MNESLTHILGEGCPEVLYDFDKEGVEFSEIRRLYQYGEYIGGSEAASVLGWNPYSSALTLWMQKSGREEIPDISDKPAVRWGNLLEPIVLSETAEILSVHIEKPNYMYLHPLHHFMTANFDGITEDGKLLEVKTSDSYAIKSSIEVGQIHLNGWLKSIITVASGFLSGIAWQVNHSKALSFQLKHICRKIHTSSMRR